MEWCLMRRLFILLLALAAVVPEPLYAQAPAATPTPAGQQRLQTPGCDPLNEPRSMDRRRLYDLFHSMVEQVNSLGFERQLRQRLDELLGIYRSSELGDMQYLSSALVRMGVQLRGQGRQEVAQQLASAALELWPGNVDAYELRARLHLDGGVVGVPLAAFASLQGTLQSFQDFWRAFFLAHRLLIWLLVVLAAIVSVWILSWTIAYYQLWCHDLSELLGGSLPRSISWLVGAVVPLLPLLLGQGLLWTLVILLVLIWPYGSRLEKTFMALTGGLLLGFPYAARPLSAALHVYDKPLAHALLYVEGGEEWNEQVWNELSALAGSSQGDPLPAFLLGNLYYENRCYYDAADKYQQAVASDRRFAKALNNLGNTLYQQGNPDGAIVKYQEALRVEPELCSAHINLNLVFNEKFEFDAAARSLDKAKDICPESVRRQVERDLSRVDKHEAVIKEQISVRNRLYELYQAGLGSSPPLGEQLWPERMLGVPVSSLPMLALGLLAAFALRSSVIRISQQTRYCIKCSRPTCPKCQLPQASQLYCGQCVRLFILRSGIDAQVQKAGVARTKQLQQSAHTRARMVNLVLPGGGHLLAGRRVAGLVLLTLWAAVWALYLRPELPVFSYLDIFHAPRHLLNATLIVLAAVIWALANLFIPTHE
jgi:hypothetical protein